MGGLVKVGFGSTGAHIEGQGKGAGTLALALLACAQETAAVCLWTFKVRERSGLVRSGQVGHWCCVVVLQCLCLGRFVDAPFS